MHALPLTLWVLGGLMALIGLLAILGASRYRALNTRIGAFTCDLRKGRLTGKDPRRFTPGVACYGTGRLDWYTAWSLSPIPAHSWRRESLEILQREPAVGRGGEFLVSCRGEGRHFDLLMSPSAYAGLASWLEAAPTSTPEII
jgi:hypothetical protein